MIRRFLAAGALACLAAAPAFAAPDPAATGAPSPTAPEKTGMSAPAESAAVKRYPVEIPPIPDSTVVALLRRGNHVLLVRHASTDWGQRDADVVNFADRSAQRNLSAIGRAQADSIGKAVKALKLPIGRIYASPMYRCRDTAELAFGPADTTSNLFVKSKPSRDARVAWLSTPLTDGKLLVLVSHQDPYIPLFKFQRDQMKEADAILIEPLGKDQWKLVAQLTPADWTRLAARFGN